MEALESVEWNNDTAVALPDRLFCNCTSLKDIKISGVTSVGKRAFSRCSAIDTIDLEGLLKSVGDYAFERCFGLETLSLRGSEVELGNSILSNSPGSDSEGCSLILGGTVRVKPDTFKDASLKDLKLTGDEDKLILVEDGVEKPYTIMDGMLFADGIKTLYKVFSGSVKRDSDGNIACSVPEGTERIADDAFSGISSSLHLPESVSKMDSRAFSKCFVQTISLGSDNENEGFIVENNALYEKTGVSGTAVNEAAAKEAAVNEPAPDDPAADVPAAEETVTDGTAAEETVTDGTAAEEAVTDGEGEKESAPDEAAAEEEAVDETAAKEAAAGSPENLYRLIKYCRPGNRKDEVVFIIPDNVTEIAPYAFCGCGVNTTIQTGPRSSSKLNKISDNAFTASGIVSTEYEYYEYFTDAFGTFKFDDSWTAGDIKALDYDMEKAFERNDYYPPTEEEEEDDDEEDEPETPDVRRDDYRYDESDGYNRPRREDEIPDIYPDPGDQEEDPLVYRSLAGGSSLFDEAKFSSYKDTHSDFAKWSEEYLKYNSDNHLVDLTSSEIVPYTMLYKGEQHYRTMACVLNDDEYKKEHSIREIGDDYHDMYLMMDHGLFAEIERCRMPCDIVLYSGITTERAAQMAGKGKNDDYTTQDLINSIGNYYTDAAMMSTTASKQIAAGFSSHSNTMVIIYASKSAIDEVGAINIDCMDSMFGGEEEILLSNNAKYRILDVGTLSYESGDNDLERTCIKLELIGKASAADEDEDAGEGKDAGKDSDADGGADRSGKADKSKKKNKPDTGDRGYGIDLTMFLISAAALSAMFAGRRREKRQK